VEHVRVLGRIAVEDRSHGSQASKVLPAGSPDARQRI
jgi:hypothetical protein